MLAFEKRSSLFSPSINGEREKKKFYNIHAWTHSPVFVKK